MLNVLDFFVWQFGIFLRDEFFINVEVMLKLNNF